MATAKDGVSAGMLVGVFGLAVTVLVSVVGGVWVLRDKFDELHTNIVVLQSDMKQVKGALKIPDETASATLRQMPPNAPLAGVPQERTPLPNVGAKGWP